MSNELKDLANRLCKYDSIADGWQIVSAVKQADGSWDLKVIPCEEDEDKEAPNDNNE